MAKSSTSLTMRLRRTISSSMSATAALTSCRRQVVPAQPAQRRLDDHQRVANLVRDDGRQPSERREPLALRRLALEACDRIGHRVEGRGEQPRVLVFPMWRRRHRNLAGQVAGRGHLTHGRGDHAERAGDRSRDAVAQDRGREDRDAGDHEHRRVQRTQEREAVRARAQDDGLCRGGRLPERGALRPVGVDIGRQRHGDRDVVVVVEDHLLRQAIVGEQRLQGPPSARAAMSTLRSCCRRRRRSRCWSAARNRAAARRSRLNPMLSVPRISGASAGLIQMGTETSCRMPPGWGTNELVSWPLTARRTPTSDSGARACWACGQSRQHAAVPVGHEEEVGGQLLLVLPRRPSARCWRRHRRPRP